MDLTDEDRLDAELQMQRLLRAEPRVVRARYDRHSARVVLRLNTGLDLTLPVHLVQGLSDAALDDLAEIEISPTGLGLHWPRLDADLYVPSLLAGKTGSAAWMINLSESGQKPDRKRRAASKNLGR